MIRILHTADWHIGQTLRGFARDYEHSVVFDRLVNIVQEREVDSLIVAGDIFDSQHPSGDAQRLFFETVARLHQSRPAMSIILVAGNHDAAGRLEAPNPLLAAFNVRVVGNVRWQNDRIDSERHLITLTDLHGEPSLHVMAVSYPTAACLPVFLRPEDDEVESPVISAVRRLYDELHEALVPRFQGLPF